LFGYDVRTFVPPMMYNNCGNMGLPLAVLAFGTSGLGSAVALFMACNLVYFSVGIKILESGARDTPIRASRWQFLRNPMMVAMLFGTAFAAIHVPLPQPLFLSLKML